ncbi:hypothetical protein Btru_032480 [Bulinus truncatus]|nr:hypothetical protein Btru_032480 [Bulinus truncatus]
MYTSNDITGSVVKAHNQTQEYILFNITGDVYCLSNTSTFNVTYHESIDQCHQIGAELALFENNAEYIRVNETLSKYSSLEIQAWISINATKTDSSYSLQWKNEDIKSFIWAPGEPSEECCHSYQNCCARMRTNMSKNQSGLADNNCTTHYNFLCKYNNTHHGNYCGIQETLPPCRSGYRFNTSTKSCVDIDECAENAHNCSDLCNNTVGSFECFCLSGYKLINRTTCVDIDECGDQLHNCSNRCNDSEGRYKCCCNNGYTNQTNCLDIDLCQDKSMNCSQCPCNNRYKCQCNERQQRLNNCTQHCLNLNGSYTCACDVGFTLSADNVTCLDVDECLNVTCDHNCTNTVGSYHCTCRHGYYLDPTNLTTCLDYDECNENISHCDLVNVSYTSTADRKCTEQTNNSFPKYPIYDHICNNTIGNYKCTCRTGYILDPSDHKSCLDINEYNLNRSLCEFNCLNTPGSYYCTCPYGYQLSTNGHSCLKKNIINYCPCSCSSKLYNRDISREHVAEYLKTLTRSIKVDKNKLLSTLLQLSSQVDDRPSSTIIGYIGIVFVILVLFTIVLSDIITVIAIIVSIMKAKRNGGTEPII